jgi:hypothetical protein
VEYDGNLYVIYSVGKEDAELAIIPLESLAVSDSFPTIGFGDHDTAGSTIQRQK